MALLLLSLLCAAGPSQYDIEEFARYSFELARSARTLTSGELSGMLTASNLRGTVG